MAITLSTSLGNVTIKESYEGYEAGIDLSRGPYIRKTYLAPSWNVAFAVTNALMGIGGLPVPHKCPESPGLRCLNARVVPRAEYDARDGGRPQFNLPLIECDYGILPWEGQVQDDPAGMQSFPDGPYLFMEQSIEFAGEIIKWPRTTYQYLSNLKPVDEPVMVSVGTARFTIIRHWNAQFPVVSITNYLNRVNTSTFLGQPAGQVMFLGGRTRRTWVSDGMTTQEVELGFRWREISFNLFPDPTSRGFVAIGDNAGNPPYIDTDLSPLLTLPVLT